MTMKILPRGIRESSATVYSLLALSAQNYSENEAVLFEGRRTSYAELMRLVDEFARALLAVGVKPGERVAYYGNPSLNFWVSFVATTSIGAIWVGLNPVYRTRELAHVLNDAMPSTIISPLQISGEDLQHTIEPLVASCEFISNKICLEATSKWMCLADLVARGNAAFSDAQLLDARSNVRPDDAALVVYTSGSTGAPKGAVLSHYGLVYGAYAQLNGNFVEQPRSICCFPINHVACLADICLVAFAAGGSVIFQEKFSPKHQAEAIRTERVTLWGAVPTMIQMCLESPEFEGLDLSGIELIVWGGASLPKSFIKKLNLLGPRLQTVYGMTETSSNTCRTDPDASIDALTGTIGKQDKAFLSRVMTKEGVRALPGEVGELQFKGRYLFKEYFRNAEATREAFTNDAWFKTGDQVEVMGDGNLKLVGRLKEMFKSGGYNVYPREIELAIEELEAVESAAVIGVADTSFQEVGKAYVQLKPGSKVDENRIKSLLKEQLANYKVPKHIEFLDCLPLLPVGKIDKPALKILSDATIQLKPPPCNEGNRNV